MQSGTQKTFISENCIYDEYNLFIILIKFLTASSDGILADIRTLISGYYYASVISRKMILGHTKREFSNFWSLALKWDMFYFEK